MSNIDLMEAELDEGVEILRPYYPDADDEHLRSRAAHWRHFRYEKGRWPTDQEIIAEIIATLARESELAAAAARSAESEDGWEEFRPSLDFESPDQGERHD